jgi:radical SAM protein with 4Fe4S-binding SPASM domain
MGCRDVSLFGGEPLLREDFWDIVETFRDRGFTVRVNTNGTRITKCFACRAEKGDIALFTVSLDGARAAVHDRQRGPGAFDKTLSGIGRLVRAGRKVLVSVTVTRLNFENLEAIAKLGRELGVEGVRFNEVHLGGHAACHPAAVRLDGREKRETLERVRALEREFGDFVSGSWIDLSGLMKRAEREKPPGFPLVVRPCGAGMGSVCIRADGRITPCEILWDADCGNVLHRPLREIYERSPAMNRFRRPLVLDARELPACRNCRYLSVCFQGHRCAPYHFPGRGLEARAGLGCWRDA